MRRGEEDLNEEEQGLVEELRTLIQEGRTRMVGLVRQELLSGIRTEAQYEKLRKVLQAFPDEHIRTTDFQGAALGSNQCRSRGVSVSVVEALICEIARNRDWAVFTTDPDFARYGRVLPIKLHAAGK